MKSKEELASIRAALPRTNLDLKHTEGCTVLPNRQYLLRALPSGGIVAEVGVAHGDFSQDILVLNKPSKLFLIDSWSDPRFANGMITVNKRFQREIDYGSIELIRNTSIEALEQFPDRFFDWVYLDTNHRYETTAKELEVCERKVKHNGKIAGHDFCVGNVVRGKLYGVIQACSKFCAEHNWCYEYLTIESGGHFSFCIGRM